MMPARQLRLTQTAAAVLCLCFAAGARADIVAAATDTGDAAAAADGKSTPVRAATVPMQTVRIKGLSLIHI